MATNSVKIKMTYADSTTRDYELSVDENDMMDIEDNIIAINASLTAGTDGGLKSFFVSNGGASLARISEAQIISVTETVLDLGGNA